MPTPQDWIIYFLEVPKHYRSREYFTPSEVRSPSLCRARFSADVIVQAYYCKTAIALGVQLFL
ncbi:hypothetical protein [Nostoc sp.]|uniref:hypothetical protein n=1 Tax=Nostoc sp. TaxID=1180 RepID=UPI002FFCF108